MMQSQSRRVLRDADCDDDEPLINLFNAVPAADRIPNHVSPSSSSDLSENSSAGACSASESESGDEQVMFFNPLFFKFQKDNWLIASKEAAKQFEARKGFDIRNRSSVLTQKLEARRSQLGRSQSLLC